MRHKYPRRGDLVKPLHPPKDGEIFLYQIRGKFKYYIDIMSDMRKYKNRTEFLEDVEYIGNVYEGEIDLSAYDHKEKYPAGNYSLYLKSLLDYNAI